MAIDIRYRNGMDQKNTADLVPVVDMAILSTLAPGFFLFLLSSHYLPGAFLLQHKRSILEDFKRFQLFPDNVISGTEH